MLVTQKNKLHLSEKHLPRQPENSFLPNGHSKDSQSIGSEQAHRQTSWKLPGYSLLNSIPFYGASLSTLMPEMGISFARMKRQFDIYTLSFAAATTYRRLPLIRYSTPSTSVKLTR